jgi:hypothetical protein
MTKSALLASVAAAAGLSAESGDITVDAGFIKKHFPDVASALISEGKAEGAKTGADAERARIAGIEAAALPGHEAIIKAHKDDPSKSPADAAMAVLNAEKAVRAGQLAALDKDEKQVKVGSEPANPAPASTSAAKPEGLEGEAAWKVEFAGSKSLQAEFGTEAAYVALRRAEANGRVKRLKNRAA